MATKVFEPRQFFVLDRSWDRHMDITWKATKYTKTTISYIGVNDNNKKPEYTIHLLFVDKYDRHGDEFTEVWLELLHGKKRIHKIITYGVYRDVLDVVRQIMWDPYRY